MLKNSTSRISPLRTSSRMGLSFILRPGFGFNAFYQAGLCQGHPGHSDLSIHHCASAGSNGTISPSGAISVNSGGSQTFTITPATGYQTASVLIDGPVGALASYTFSDVTANHTISASFATANQPPVAEAGPDQTVAQGTRVTLNGSNSTDVGGPGIASYQWTQIGGTRARLSNPHAAITTFSAPTRIGALTFQLTVRDKNGLPVKRHLYRQCGFSRAGGHSGYGQGRS